MLNMRMDGIRKTMSCDTRRLSKNGRAGQSAQAVLLVESDLERQREMRCFLDGAGYNVRLAGTAQSCLHQLRLLRPDLLLINVDLPDMDGFQLCQHIREFSSIPIVLISVGAGQDMMLSGYRNGADYVLTESPTSPLLLAYMETLLRWDQKDESKESPRLAYADDYLIINLDRREVLAGGKLLKLTKTEFEILTYLVRHQGYVMTPEQILARIWGEEHTHRMDFLYKHISGLRRKIEEDPRRPRYIQTYHGMGYAFENLG